MRSRIEEHVLGKIRPGPAERRHIADVAGQLLEIARSVGVAEAMIVGSVARDTWIHGDRDLDLFLLFDPSLTRQDLEEKGLALAKEIAGKMGAPYLQKYAEHPYINASVDGLDVDIVPCFRVESAEHIRSAVDRTPFHTRYIQDRIGPFVDDVLLLKQFTKAGGVYGSDQMTEGFSGYLCELLVLSCRGFQGLLESAAGWRPGTLIDPEDHRTKQFSEPLVMVDPVDPGRNVSASVSLDRMFEFVELARGYLETPSELFFFPPDEDFITKEGLLQALREKGTVLLGLSFPTPPYIADIVVPQLRRSLYAVRALLERNGFIVYAAECEMHDLSCILLFELASGSAPLARRHTGPPVWNQPNADKFSLKYRDGSNTQLLSGPFIEDGRYIVEVRRRYTEADDLLRSDEVLEVSLGKHVRLSLEKGWEVNRDHDCWSAESAPFITRFFRKESPLTRIRRLEKNSE
ncbi:MAG: CCA tRNA nucleotidyltransferase [Methanoregulaceae archaeon]|nr:CCA tRNA nucleotidyltransferase [Methanoregulaceae archaeon]